MLCQRCGTNLNGSESFCPMCGERQPPKPVQTNQVIRLKCQQCGGVMNVDANRQIMFCPYCGSKNLIMESDAVKIERIKTDAMRDIELQRAQTYQTVETQKQQAYRDTKLAEYNTELESKKIEHKEFRVSIIVGMALLIFTVLISLLMSLLY